MSYLYDSGSGWRSLYNGVKDGNSFNHGLDDNGTDSIFLNPPKIGENPKKYDIYDNLFDDIKRYDALNLSILPNESKSFGGVFDKDVCDLVNCASVHNWSTIWT